MSKHTPGPWKVLKGHTGYTWFVIYKTRESRQRTEAAKVYKDLRVVKSGDVEAPAVASIGAIAINYQASKTENEIEAEANANLIAAAPELLDALKCVLAVADRKTKEFDAARAAIAKAEGGGNP